jgi:SAM-dependent methyltransferase
MAVQEPRQRHRPLPYTKVCDLAHDTAELQPYLDRITPEILEGQHPIRRWEYAMTLRTIEAWRIVRPLIPALEAGPLRICDVGGAGSNFWELLLPLTSAPVTLVDAAAIPRDEGRLQVWAEYLEDHAQHVPPRQYDIITCISVIEHVDLLPPFFRAITSLLRPGGLLCLTTDFWNAEGPDTAHFHWMRTRIYNEASAKKLLAHVRELGYTPFGGSGDWAYAGHQLYDYSVCTMALTKKETPR